MDRSFWDLYEELGKRYSCDVTSMENELARLRTLLKQPSQFFEPEQPEQPGTSSMSAQKLSRSPSRGSGEVSPTRRKLSGRSLSGLPSVPPVGVGSQVLVPLPKEELELLELGSSALWQSAAFQEDLQTCLQHRRQMTGFLSSEADVGKDSASSRHLKGSPADVHFQPRAFWGECVEEQQLEAKVRGRTSAPTVISAGAITPIQVQSHQSFANFGTFRWLRPFQHPGSTFKTWWDTFGMFLLIYDLIVIPLRAFDIGESFFLTFMFWTAHLYWNAAIPMSFITGYDECGVLVLDLRKTIRRYGRLGLA